MNSPDHAHSGDITAATCEDASRCAQWLAGDRRRAQCSHRDGTARGVGSGGRACLRGGRGPPKDMSERLALLVYVLRERKGPVADQLLEALEPPGVLGVVMGLRAFISGPRPAGSTALGVLRAAAKPILFVPPEAYFPSAFEPRRLLVPLDGTHETSSAFLEFESALQSDVDREVTVVHTLDGYGAPLMERPEHDLPAWANSFVRQHCPGEHRSFVWRTGNPADAVIKVAEKAGSDLIVLSFRGDIEVGHGAVVREVLARSPIPVLVLPVSRSASSDDAETDESNLRVNHQIHSVKAG